MGNEQSRPLPDASIIQYDDSSPHDSDSIEVTDEESDNAIDLPPAKRQKLTKGNLKHISKSSTDQVERDVMARLNVAAGAVMPPPQTQKSGQKLKSATVSSTPTQTKSTNTPTSQNVDLNSTDKKRRKRKSRSARESRNSTSGSVYTALDRSDAASRRSSVIQSDSINETDDPVTNRSRSSSVEQAAPAQKPMLQPRRHVVDLHRILSPEEQKIFAKEPELFGVYATSDGSGSERDTDNDETAQPDKQHTTQSNTLLRDVGQLEESLLEVPQTPPDTSANDPEPDLRSVEAPVASLDRLTLHTVARDLHPLKNGRWPCPLAAKLACTKTFQERKGAMRHAENHTDPDKYKCEKCDRGFSRKDKHDSHARKCQGTKVVAAHNAQSATQQTKKEANNLSTDVPTSMPQSKPTIDTSYPVSVPQPSPAKRNIADTAGDSHTISKDMDLGEALDHNEESAAVLQDNDEIDDHDNDGSSDVPGGLLDAEDAVKDTNPSHEGSSEQEIDLEKRDHENQAIHPTSHKKLEKARAQAAKSASNEPATPELLRGVDLTSHVKMSQLFLQPPDSSRLKRKRPQVDHLSVSPVAESSRKRARPSKDSVGSSEDVQFQDQTRGQAHPVVNGEFVDTSIDPPKTSTSKKETKKSRSKLTRKELARNTTLNGFVQRQSSDHSEQASSRPESSTRRTSDPLVSVDIPRVPSRRAETVHLDHSGPPSRKGKERAHSAELSSSEAEEDRIAIEQSHDKADDNYGDRPNDSDTPPQSTSKLKTRKHKIRNLRTRDSDTSSDDEKPSRKAKSKARATSRVSDVRAVKGRFSDREIGILEDWRLNFCDEHGISKTKFNDMITQAAKRERDVVWPYKGVERRELLQEFRAQLPHRDRKSMQRFRERYFQNASVEPWTAEDDDELRDLVTKIGTKWTEIGEMLNRTRDACHSRWKFQLNYGREINHGDWSVKETERLQAEVIAAAKLKGVDPEDQAADLPWSAIAEKVGSRSAQQCSNKWRLLYNYRGQDNKFVKIPFADRIGEAGLDGERTPGKTRKRLIKSEEIVVDSSDEDEMDEPVQDGGDRASNERTRSDDRVMTDSHDSREDDKPQEDSDVDMLDPSDEKSESQSTNEHDEAVAVPTPAVKARQKTASSSSQPVPTMIPKNVTRTAHRTTSSSQPQPDTTPAESRNPFKGSTRTPAKGLSMTQLLDGTQANTTAKKASQFSKSGSQREERPSPIVNLARPQASSPLKPIAVAESSESDEASSDDQAASSNESSDTDEETVSSEPAASDTATTHDRAVEDRPDTIVASQTIPRTELRKQPQLRKTYAKSPQLKQGSLDDPAQVAGLSSQVIPQTSVINGFRNVNIPLEQPQSFSARLQAAAKQSNKAESEQSSEETASESEPETRSESDSKSRSVSDSNEEGEEQAEAEEAQKEKQKTGFFRSILNIWPGSSSQKTAGASQSSPAAKRRRLEDVLVGGSSNGRGEDADVEESSDDDL